MQFEKPLILGTLIKRYKRFFVDVKLDDGSVVVAHCPNTGSMLGLLEEGYGAAVTSNNNPKRKLKYTLEMIALGNSGSNWVGVNTGRPNKIVAEAIEQGFVAELLGYENIRHEVKYGKNSRIDLLLEASNKPDCYVEVKNVTLREGNNAMFTDAVTARGLKHLEELLEMVKQGKRAVMLYLVQREDCKKFMPADHIDPIYCQKLRKVMAEGVEAVCYDCTLSLEEISIRRKLSIIIE